ncbi:phosphotransferase [Actinomadura syzygii]|uniref:aminoglycoside phosphotransferase family protein n=1 Tax=Actinomadura syzygii TaxID=1427538 RepID=UPI00319DC5F6
MPVGQVPPCPLRWEDSTVLDDRCAALCAAERAGLCAAERAGLGAEGVRLVSRGSRLVWHAPAGDAAITVTRPGTTTLEQVSHEIRLTERLRKAGVNTPRILAGPIRACGRFAFVTQWVERAPTTPHAQSWPLIAEQAARFPGAGAGADGVQPVRMPEVPVSTWRDRLGSDMGEAFADRWDNARQVLGELLGHCEPVVCHDDQHPDNALIDRQGRCWLLDLELVAAAPPERDPASLVVLNRRFGDPSDPEALLTYWPALDPQRLSVCARVREVLIVGRLLLRGTQDAVTEGTRRAQGLFGHGPPWHHLAPLPAHRS